MTTLALVRLEGLEMCFWPDEWLTAAVLEGFESSCCLVYWGSTLEEFKSDMDIKGGIFWQTLPRTSLLLHVFIRNWLCLESCFFSEWEKLWKKNIYDVHTQNAPCPPLTPNKMMQKFQNGNAKCIYYVNEKCLLFQNIAVCVLIYNFQFCV